MAPHPCCGGSLQTGTKVIAIVEIVLSTIVFALTLLAVVGLLAFYKHHEPETAEEKENKEKFSIVAVVILGIVLLMKIFQLIVAIILLLGANQRNVRKCKIWFIVTCIIVGYSAITFIYGLINGSGGGQQTFTSIFNLVINVYFLWVVKAFMDELNAEGTSSGGVVYNKP